MLPRCKRTTGHCEFASTKTEILRPARFCRYWIFLSVVSSTWKPAASAAFSKSRLESLSQPRSRASTTVCPTSAGAMPLGVPWSKRTSIVGRGRRDLNRWRIQAASCKFEHSPDLFRRHMELLNDFLDAGARFEILEDRRHGHPCTSKNPCTAAPARHAFHYRTLRPVKCCHRESPFVILAHGCVSPSGAGRSPLDSQRARTFPAVGHLSARKQLAGDLGGLWVRVLVGQPEEGVPTLRASRGCLLALWRFSSVR